MKSGSKSTHSSSSAYRAGGGGIVVRIVGAACLCIGVDVDGGIVVSIVGSAVDGAVARLCIGVNADGVGTGVGVDVFHLACMKGFLAILATCG